MRLEFEARSYMTPVEIQEWFHVSGFTVYDVKTSAPFGREDHKTYGYFVTIGDEAGERALRELQGKLMGGAPVVLRRDSGAFGV